VIVNALKLIHNRADVLDAVSKLHTHCLFNDTYQRVAVMHGAKIVQTVSQGEGLRIHHALHHLLHTAMDVSQMGINVLDGLAIDNGLQTQHAVR